MNDLERFALSKHARLTGSPCQICGWKDGDGAATCFYSAELGIVSHQNSELAVLQSMTEEQQQLYKLRSALVYINEELREKRIQLVAYDHHQYVLRQLKSHPERYPTINGAGEPISEEVWNADYRARQMKEGLANEEPYRGWIREYWWVPVERQVDGPIPEHLRGPVKTSRLALTGGSIVYTAYMTHVHEPHSCGKGFKEMSEPYHFYCTGCAVEIKLWEHGVDYDVG